MFLVKNGADPTTQSPHSPANTLLHEVVLANTDKTYDNEITELLTLDKNLINATNKEGYTPLKLLITQFDYKKLTFDKFIKQAMFLVKNGADPTTQSPHSPANTLLHEVVLANKNNAYDNEITQLLTLNKNLEQVRNQNGNTPLQELLQGRAELLVTEVHSKFLELSDLTTINNIGETLLHSACYAGNLVFAQYLVTKGLAFNAKTKQRKTLLHSSSTKRCNNTELWQWLLDNKLDINAQDNSGYTALCIAVIHNNTTMVEWLIKNKARLDLENDLGKTPYGMVLKSNKKTLIDLLIAAGALEIEKERALKKEEEKARKQAEIEEKEKARKQAEEEKKEKARKQAEEEEKEKARKQAEEEEKEKARKKAEEEEKEKARKQAEEEEKAKEGKKPPPTRLEGIHSILEKQGKKEQFAEEYKALCEKVEFSVDSSISEELFYDRYFFKESMTIPGYYFAIEQDEPVVEGKNDFDCLQEKLNSDKILDKKTPCHIFYRGSIYLFHKSKGVAELLISGGKLEKVAYDNMVQGLEKDKALELNFEFFNKLIDEHPECVTIFESIQNENLPYMPPLHAWNYSRNVYGVDDNLLAWMLFAKEKSCHQLFSCGLKKYEEIITTNLPSQKGLHAGRALSDTQQKSLMKAALELQFIHKDSKAPPDKKPEQKNDIKNELINTLKQYDKARFKSYARSRMFQSAKTALEIVKNDESYYYSLHNALSQARMTALEDDRVRKNIHRDGESRYLNVLNQALDQVITAWGNDSTQTASFAKFAKHEKDNFIKLLENPPLTHGCEFCRMDRQGEVDGINAKPKKSRYILAGDDLYYQSIHDQKPTYVNILYIRNIREHITPLLGNKKSINLSSHQLERISSIVRAYPEAVYPIANDLPPVTVNDQEINVSKLLTTIWYKKDNLENTADELKQLKAVAEVVSDPHYKESGAVKRYCKELLERLPAMIQYCETSQTLQKGMNI